MILGIDPGPERTAWVQYFTNNQFNFGIAPSREVIGIIRQWGYSVAIERIASYGMSVGAEVFETAEWCGRFALAAEESCKSLTWVYRRDVKLHLCGSPRAKDSNIRQALIDKFGAPGTKKNPGLTYGLKADQWSALAVAVTAAETRSE